MALRVTPSRFFTAISRTRSVCCSSSSSSGRRALSSGPAWTRLGPSSQMQAGGAGEAAAAAFICRREALNPRPLGTAAGPHRRNLSGSPQKFRRDPEATLSPAEKRELKKQIVLMHDIKQTGRTTKDWAKVREVVDIARKEGVLMDRFSRCAAIEAAGYCQNVTAVQALLRDATKKEEVDVVTYTVSMRACFRCRDYDEGMAVWEQLEADDKVQPDTKALKLALKTSVYGGELYSEQATAIEEKLLEMGESVA